LGSFGLVNKLAAAAWREEVADEEGVLREILVVHDGGPSETKRGGEYAAGIVTKTLLTGRSSSRRRAEKDNKGATCGGTWRYSGAISRQLASVFARKNPQTQNRRMAPSKKARAGGGISLRICALAVRN
jgi:hypothetical protein